MKSIEQIDTENDTKSLISSFINLIGLAKLTKQVNFKRKSVSVNIFAVGCEPLV